jgi:hypothetical protein
MSDATDPRRDPTQGANPGEDWDEEDDDWDEWEEEEDDWEEDDDELWD